MGPTPWELSFNLYGPQGNLFWWEVMGFWAFPTRRGSQWPEGESLSEEQEGLSRTRSPAGTGTNAMQIQSHCITPCVHRSLNYALAGEAESPWAN